MSTTNFIYNQLNDVCGEIRLLKILPGDNLTPVVCTLSSAPIADCPSYDALSYTWGPQDPGFKITINDGNFTIGGNLHKALRDMRSTDESICIWVDAICINQLDIPERGSQVQLMTEIYQGAKTVHAWIDHEIIGAEEENAFYQVGRIKHQSDVAKYPDAFWQPVKQLFGNPYFSRLWIQQELILASHVKVHLRKLVIELAPVKLFWDEVKDSVMSRSTGPMGLNLPLSDFRSNISPEEVGRFSENDFMGSIHLFSHLGVERDPPGIQLLESPGKRRWDFSSTSSVGLLLETVNAAGDLNMTDQRDQMYGVLGVAHDVGPGDVSVDYSLALPQVYAKVCRHHLSKYSELSFLGFWLKTPAWLTAGGVEAQKDIPSWQRGIARGFAIRWGEMSSSAAAGCTTASHAQISENGRNLKVRGILVDTVRERQEASRPVESVPIVELVASLTAMCKRIWPDFQEGALLDREEIVSLFFPWFDDHRYSVGALGLGEKPSPGQKRWILSQIVVRAIKSVMQGGPGEISLVDELRNPTLFPDVPLDYLILWLRLIVVGIAHSFFFTTTGGRVGRISHNIPLLTGGDQVWILFGFTLPIVLRPVSNDPSNYKVVGPAIIPGLMDGEACTNVTASGELNNNDTGLEIRSITLC